MQKFNAALLFTRTMPLKDEEISKCSKCLQKNFDKYEEAQFVRRKEDRFNLRLEIAFVVSK